MRHQGGQYQQQQDGCQLKDPFYSTWGFRPHWAGLRQFKFQSKEETIFKTYKVKYIIDSIPI